MPFNSKTCRDVLLWLLLFFFNIYIYIFLFLEIVLFVVCTIKPWQLGFTMLLSGLLAEQRSHDVPPHRHSPIHGPHTARAQRHVRMCVCFGLAFLALRCGTRATGRLLSIAWGGFLTSLRFHNNIRLHASILSSHIVGLIFGNIVSKIKDLLLFWKF